MKNRIIDALRVLRGTHGIHPKGASWFYVNPAIYVDRDTSGWTGVTTTTGNKFGPPVSYKVLP